MTLFDQAPWAIAALVLAAVLVGVAKTSIAGIGGLSVALFAAVLPARESTGAVLPLLILGDVLGVASYWRHADWPRLVRLFPAVAVGVLAGVGFVAVADDAVMRRTIGAVLLVLVAVNVALRRARAGSVAPPERTPRALTWVYGGLAGFTTMVANAAGPVMSLYLLSAKLEKIRFLGTMAWFFALVNLFKVPFSVGLGLITPSSLTLNAVLAPALLVGALFGRWLVKRINQAWFERLVLMFTVVAGINLLR